MRIGSAINIERFARNCGFWTVHHCRLRPQPWTPDVNQTLGARLWRRYLQDNLTKVYNYENRR